MIVTARKDPNKVYVSNHEYIDKENGFRWASILSNGNPVRRGSKHAPDCKKCVKDAKPTPEPEPDPDKQYVKGHFYDVEADSVRCQVTHPTTLMGVGMTGTVYTHALGKKTYKHSSVCPCKEAPKVERPKLYMIAGLVGYSNVVFTEEEIKIYDEYLTKLGYAYNVYDVSYFDKVLQREIDEQGKKFDKEDNRLKELKELQKNLGVK